MFFQSVASVDTPVVCFAHMSYFSKSDTYNFGREKSKSKKNIKKLYALKILEFKTLNWNQITLQTFHQKELPQKLRPKHFGIKMYIRPRKKEEQQKLPGAVQGLFSMFTWTK